MERDTDSREVTTMDADTATKLYNLFDQANSQANSLHMSLHATWRYYTDVTDEPRSQIGKAADLVNEACHILMQEANRMQDLMNEAKPVDWAGRTFGQLSPAEQTKVARQAAQALGAEMTANATAIAKILEDTRIV